MIRTSLAAIVLIILVAVACYSDSADFAVGFKSMGGSPFFTMSGLWNEWTVELGTWTSTHEISNVSFSRNNFYVQGEYHLPLYFSLDTYLGAGVIGVTLNRASSSILDSSVSTTGSFVVAGLERTVPYRGASLLFFLGVHYVTTDTVEVTIDNETSTIPLDISETGTHLGVRWDF